MVVASLVEGNNTITWTLDGYQQLTAIINVSPTGVATCVSVTGGLCKDSKAPTVIVAGTTITGYLAPSSQTTPTPSPSSGICDWITSKGGKSNLGSFDISTLVMAYLGFENLGFQVTSAHISGCIMYYLGVTNEGDTLTGC